MTSLAGGVPGGRTLDAWSCVSCHRGSLCLPQSGDCLPEVGLRYVASCLADNLGENLIHERLSEGKRSNQAVQIDFCPPTGFAALQGQGVASITCLHASAALGRVSGQAGGFHDR